MIPSIRSFPVVVALLMFCSITAAADDQPRWPFLKHYDQEHLAQIALPLGGIGTGTVSLGGRGDLRDWEIVNRPAKGFTPSSAFFAIRIAPNTGPVLMRALQGPVERFQYYGGFGVKDATNPGLPCFRTCSFDAGYPFGQVNLSDAALPVSVRIKAFNPLVPTDPDASGIPIAILRYEVTNLTSDSMSVAVCGSLENFIGNDGTKTLAAKNKNAYREGNGFRGIMMSSTGVDPHAEQWGTIALTTSGPGDVSYRTSWLPNNWGTALLDLWDDLADDGMLADRTSGDQTPRGSLAVRRVIAPHATAVFSFALTWSFPNRFAWSSRRVGNYYATRYADAWDVIARTHPDLERLERETVAFTTAFCQSAIPDVVKESALFNLSTLRSQTCFRTEDGRFFAWEGCGDKEGCCLGSCTHVWNYEQATAFLFGSLARSMREVEFATQTDDIGLMSFRVSLPVSERSWNRAAADGQMGCVMKAYRDWQLSGDDTLLASLYPNIRKALQFAWLPGGWDGDMDGVMEGCQHNTMDVEYFGPNPQMGLWYLGALRAGERMALYMKDTSFAQTCHTLGVHGSAWLDSVLFNGRYYIHKVIPPQDRSRILPGLIVGAGAKDLVNPDYQLANGCLVDQLVGQYMAHVCGLGYLVEPRNVQQTLRSIMKYNFKESLADHFNCMRTFALGDESALLMASYPDGRPANPFPYFSEVMTGFEYTAAIGMLYEGQTAEGLRCITAVRDRYDGLKRNPYDEAECGHHYGRAMISWAGLLALTGFQYSAPEGTLQFDRCTGTNLWSTGYAYGTVTQEVGEGRCLVTITSLRGDLTFRTLTLRGYGRSDPGSAHTLRAGQSMTVEVAANDSTAGEAAGRGLVDDRITLVKPPRVKTGPGAFQSRFCFTGTTTIAFESPTPGATVRYTLDGRNPTSLSPVATGEIVLDRSATVCAVAEKDGQRSVVLPAVTFEKIKGIASVELAQEPSGDFVGRGPLTLVDGRRGSSAHTDGEWLGFEGADLDVTIDLGEARVIRSVSAEFLNGQRSWIFPPTRVEFQAGTTRNALRTVATRTVPLVRQDEARVETVKADVGRVKVRYIRVKATNAGTCPPWHAGAGGKAWLFTDEITVR